MHNAAKKLHSQRGASLIFALLVFVLCAFAGVAALVSAAANAGRYARLERDQQQYLSAASAARMLKDELCGKTVRMTLRLRQTYDWWYVPDASDPDYQRLYVRQTFEFLNKDSDTPTALQSIPSSGEYRSVPGVEDCEFLISGAGGDTPDPDSLAAQLLQNYVWLSFLSHDVPAFFFEQNNGEGYLTPDAAGNYSDRYETKPVLTAAKTAAGAAEPSGGTHEPVDGLTPGATREMELSITGKAAAGDDWAAALGAVDVTFVASDDYCLNVKVSEKTGGGDPLYTTVFELPADVSTDLSTTVEVEDDPQVDRTTLPAELQGHDITSYGRRVTKNTVTVTVKWPIDGISVTRTR